MCTVTYLPLKKGAFIITSNRDENRSRSASAPASLSAEESTLVFPKDPKSGGSWICASKDGRVVCLLNGAFEKHKHEPPYRKSRGLVVLESFSYPSFQHFTDSYKFEEIEPFTLVMRDKSNLRELRWDGKVKHLKDLDIYQEYLWASATLYSDHLIAKRKKWFLEWQDSYSNYHMDDIIHWHGHTGDGDSENDLVMNRNNIVETISITSVMQSDRSVSMKHKDLLNGSMTEFSF